MIKWGYKNYFH